MRDLFNQDVVPVLEMSRVKLLHHDAIMPQMADFAKARACGESACGIVRFGCLYA